MAEGTVEDRMLSILIKELSLPDDKIGPITRETRLKEDLGADSLDLVNLTVAIEEEFSREGKTLKFPEEAAEDIRSVQQILDFLAKNGFVDAPPPH